MKKLSLVLAISAGILLIIIFAKDISFKKDKLFYWCDNPKTNFKYVLRLDKSDLKATTISADEFGQVVENTNNLDISPYWYTFFDEESFHSLLLGIGWAINRETLIYYQTDGEVENKMSPDIPENLKVMTHCALDKKAMKKLNHQLEEIREKRKKDILF